MSVKMNDDKRDELESATTLLQAALKMIAMHDVEIYEMMVERGDNSMYHAVASMVDPTDYRKSLSDGRLEFSKCQQEIARHVAEIRKLIDKMNDAGEKYLNRNRDR